MPQLRPRHTISSLARRVLYRYLLVTMITGGNTLAWIAVGISQNDRHPNSFWLCFPLALASAWATLALTRETAHARATYRIELFGRRQRVLLAREAKGTIGSNGSLS